MVVQWWFNGIYHLGNVYEKTIEHHHFDLDYFNGHVQT